VSTSILGEYFHAVYLLGLVRERVELWEFFLRLTALVSAQMISLVSYPMCLMRRSFDGFGTANLMLFNRLLFGVLVVFVGNRVCGVGYLRWIAALSIWQVERNLLESSRFARESFCSLCDIFLS
jgi:hypothetical protein